MNDKYWDRVVKRKARVIVHIPDLDIPGTVEYYNIIGLLVNIPGQEDSRFIPWMAMRSVTLVDKVKLRDDDTQPANIRRLQPDDRRGGRDA